MPILVTAAMCRRDMPRASRIFRRSAPVRTAGSSAAAPTETGTGNARTAESGGRKPCPSS